MSRNRSAFAIGVGVCAALAHAVLFAPLPLSWRTVAALCIAGLLPGLCLVAWLLGAPADQLAVAEQGLYAVGAGYTVLVCGALFASYLPGGLQQVELLALFDGLTVLFFGLWWRLPQPSLLATASADTSPKTKNTTGWIIAAWVSLLLVGGFFRVTDLSYSEFQSDEASPALRAVAVVQGNESVLFLHKKGPTEILIPAAMLTLTGHLTEQSGRLPFALANLFCLLTVFVLGWRLLNPLAGWIAALLLALDGYYIGYAHMLQYQSILFLMIPLVVLLLYRLLPQIVPSPWGGLGWGQGFLLAALFVTTGLLSHYDGVIVFLPGLYLLWVFVRRGVPVLQLGRALLLPVCVSLVLLTSFYLPFALHPHFRETYTYYSTHVIGQGRWFYNHLAEFADRATLFNTAYAFWLMVGATLLAVVLLYRQGRSGWQGRGLTALVLLIGGLATFVPHGLTFGALDLMPWLFGLLFLGVWLLPKLSAGERLLWLWFGLPFLQALFLTKEPSAHFHVFLVPWVLIVGQTLAWLWQKLCIATGERTANLTGSAVVALCLFLFGSYAYWFFLDHSEAARFWQEIEHPPWWPVHDSVSGEPLFGVPHDSGWKVIGVLYQEGKLRGSYDTNIRTWESDWYTRGAEYCEDRAHYMFLELSRRRDKQVEFYAKKKDRYQLFGTVYVEGEPHLEIYQRDVVTTTQRFDAEAYTARFDEQLTDANLRLGPPTVEPVLTPVHYQLGEQIELVGYRLEQGQARPGGTLLLTLQWHVKARPQTDYTLFNQIIGAQDKMIGQLDAEPSCTGGPTTKWKPSKLLTGYFQIPIFADAKPGVYPLRIGLYQPATGERLPVTAADGAQIGDQIELQPISIEP